jgi:sugar phosphate isomerase/epimerase
VPRETELQDRVDDLEMKLGKLRRRDDQRERVVEAMERELAQLRAELRALGVTVPRTNPSGSTPLSPEARRVARRRSAAKARAAKRVGSGKGCVRDRETKVRLSQDTHED